MSDSSITAPPPSDTPTTRSDLQALNIKFLLAPIWPYIDDPKISEVVINGFEEIRVEQSGILSKVDGRFASAEELHAAMLAVAQFNEIDLGDEPTTFDGRLPGGARVHAVFPPASRRGLCVAIRKQKPNTLTIQQLIEWGSLSKEAAGYLEAAVTLQKNILISGGTSSGKTTILSVIGMYIPAHERVIVLEDVNEIVLSNDHVLYMEGASGTGGHRRVTIRDLFRSSLRMRPDRIIVGECRGGEALDMIQAMTSGHSGSMTTLHASTPKDALKRVETMCMMSGLELPLGAVRGQIASAVDVIVQVSRVRSGKRRVMTITEARGLNDAGNYVLVDLFRTDVRSLEKSPLAWTGEVSHWAEELGEHSDIAARAGGALTI
jgi:pilus assembly protein CpaF